MNRTQADNPTRRGITLIELLVAISIMAIMAGVAVSMMQSGRDARRVREAARGINVQLSSARTRALASGRPHGVLLRRADSRPQCVLTLEQVHVPPPYAGNTLDAVAGVRQMQQVWAGDGFLRLYAELSGFSPSLVRVGDMVQFNYQGPLYEIRGPDNDGDQVIDNHRLQLAVHPSQAPLPWPVTTLSQPVPYKVFRQPVRSLATPWNLPGATVVDLEFSGTDALPFPTGVTTPVRIMFSPNGSVDEMYVGGVAVPVLDPIFLLVGKSEKVPPEPNDANWQDPENLWLTINPRTGMISTNEVVLGGNLAASRELARESQSMGGR